MRSDSICLICGSANWTELVDPERASSVTTAGRLIAEPLGKSQCMSCGSAQRTRAPMLAFTDYYEKDYANYYERPGASAFHKQRYLEIWKWICKSISIEQPKRILDVGCGQGWLMALMQETYPDAVIEGVEPSHYNVNIAREKGYYVHAGRIDAVASTLAPFDLIVSTNVLQHVSNPHAFFSVLLSLRSKQGVMVVTCPDGSRPNIELLWADQNLSLTPSSLQTLAIQSLPAQGSYQIVQSTLPSASLPPALLLKVEDGSRVEGCVFSSEIMTLLNQRQTYLGAFARIDTFLVKNIQDSELVVNLGASYWTSILAAYCPNYWALVQYCCVDDPGDQVAFLGKPVVKTANVSDAACMVLGIAPDAQKSIALKFENQFTRIVNWSEILD